MALHWIEKLQLHCPRVAFTYPNSDTIAEAERIFSKRGIPVTFIPDVIDWASDHIAEIAGCDPTPDVICGWQARRETWLAAQRDAQTLPAKMEAIRARLRTASPEDRWEIICQAHDPKLDMLGLTHYAESLPGGNPGREVAANAMHSVFVAAKDIGAESGVGVGYVELDAGENLLPTDERQMEDGTWRAYGADSIDTRSGHPLRLYKFSNTRKVRRALNVKLKEGLA